MNKLNSALLVAVCGAGLVAVCAGAYLGVRAGLVAVRDDDPSPGASRPGIDGIVAGPTPKAPVRAPSSSLVPGQKAAPEAGAGPVVSTASSELPESSVSSAPPGTETPEGASSGGEGSEGSSPSPEPAPQPEPEPEKEDPPVIHHPGS